MGSNLERIKPRENPFMVPERVSGEKGLFRVDSTWGTIQPMEVAEGVRTVGEKEVLANLGQDLPVVDSRTRDYHLLSTIPGAKNVPHLEAVEHLGELDTGQPTIFFCNGPQCGQSPAAIRTLLGAGYPAEKILYYRGGMHDWITLGLPVVPGS